MNQMCNENMGIAGEGSALAADPMVTVATPHGVAGWLKFFVVMHLYIAPILLSLNILVSWFGYLVLMEDYPRIVVVGIIETVVLGFLMIQGIQAARGLRDLQPGAVQRTKSYLQLCLGWSLVSILPAMISGLEADGVFTDWLFRIGSSAVGFAIWYSYFNVSKRVKNTYHDCDL
ncbi:MAG: hypothetical protein ABIF77_00865 [bacterium]